MLQGVVLLLLTLLPSPVSLETVELQLKAEVYKMTMDKRQLRGLISDVLEDMDMHSEDAVELLMLTAAQESHLGTYIQQVGGGPALGIFQMEPATERDIWDNYLKYKPEYKQVIYDITGTDPRSWDLRSNLLYSIAMARLHYKRVPKALPKDVKGYARYWKLYYNTPLGKGTEEEALHNYKRLAL